MATFEGGCLCGGVRFEVEAEPDAVRYCHCTSCKKLSGGAGTVNGRAPTPAVRVVAGEEHVRTFQPAEGSAKTFCAVCGSSLFGGDWPDGAEVSVRFGALDGDPAIRPEYHTFVASAPPWDTLQDDGLPRYPEAKPGE